jgi:hypothetical protein
VMDAAQGAQCVCLNPADLLECRRATPDRRFASASLIHSIFLITGLPAYFIEFLNRLNTSTPQHLNTRT